MSEILQKKIDEQNAEIERLNADVSKITSVAMSLDRLCEKLKHSEPLNIFAYQRQKDIQNVITICMMHKVPPNIACDMYDEIKKEFNAHYRIQE